MALASGSRITIGAVALLQLLLCVNCHVRLDFPLARSLSLDFLDSVRTPPPCGMPKGESKTSFEAGTSFNATWHLGYPHQGGYKLELLDPNGKLIETLTPEKGGSKGDGWIDEDATAQRHLVKLPEEECSACTIRLMRTASEWSQGYRFWSCADVDIVKRGTLDDQQLCSKHGKHDKNGDVCVCDPSYFGERCQYKDECDSDKDCQNGGSCIDIDSTTSPRKQCFCAFGYFGQMCEKKSEISERVTDLNDYQTRQLNDDVTMHWKILEASKEIEVVVQAKTNSYFALGWRPRGTQGSCQAFPNLGLNEVEAELRSKTEIEAEGKAEPEVEPEGRSEADIEAEGNAEPEGRSVPDDDDEGKAEPEGGAEEQAARQGRAEPDVEAEGKAEPEGRSELDVEADGKAEPEGRSEPDVEAEGKAEPEGRSEPDVEAEGKSEPESKSVRAKTGHRYQPKNDKLHPMDCNDIVIGMARGDKSRIFDAYTRDRSTPMPDSFFGGKEDLTSALGYEEDGVTTIIFRKKLEGSEETDHSLVNDLTHVIWAYGQKHGMYHHQPPSGLESGKASIEDFYRPDEVKYHGKVNRGVVSMNFFEQKAPDVCMSSWRFPSDCTTNCQYEASWKPSPADGTIEFTVKQKTSKNNDDWIAIGFSHNTKMAETDIVAGFTNAIDGGLVKDFWASRYASPDLDPSQDIIDGSVKVVNGYQILNFRRKLNTGDADNDISLEKEIHLVFPYSGGPMFGTATIGKHKETPFVTDTKININQICKEATVAKKEEINNDAKDNKLEEDELLEELLRKAEPEGYAEPEGQDAPKGFEEDLEEQDGTCEQSEWKFPEGCSESECQYMAKWTKVGDSIKVSVQGKSDFSKEWIGIGFSTNPYMARSDAVIGYVDESGQGVVKDVWISSYNPPDEDASQDIKVLEIGKRDNVTFMKFLKKISSDDKERDVDFNKDVHILFPYAGGPVIAAGTIGKHRRTPEVTPEKISFNALCDKRPKSNSSSVVQSNNKPAIFEVDGNQTNVRSGIEDLDIRGNDIFSCSSSSSRRVRSTDKPGPVSFDDCQLNVGSSFHGPSGMFKPSQDGMFSMSAMALLKSDVNSGVLMSLNRIKKDGSKEILVSTMASSSSSDELKLVIGSTTSLNTLVELHKSDNVYLEVYSEGKSGLINSDWHVLKFSGYKVDDENVGLNCELIDTTRDSVLTISNCLDSSRGTGFGPAGLGRARTDHISIIESGLYRIAFSGDIETGSVQNKGPTMISLEKDNESPVGSAAGYFKLEESVNGTAATFSPQPRLNIPISFMMYAKLSSEADVKLRLKNRGDGSTVSALKNGHLTIVKEKEKSRVLSCTNDGSIESKVIIYTSCMASDDVMNLAIDLKSGVVTVPEDGFYEISLTGAMKTFAGKRIWVTLNKKTGETDDVVLAAGFSTLYYDTKLASVDLTASSTITTVEKLMKGDQVSAKMGRQGSENHIKGSPVKTVHFTLKKI